MPNGSPLPPRSPQGVLFADGKNTLVSPAWPCQLLRFGSRFARLCSPWTLQPRGSAVEEPPLTSQAPAPLCLSKGSCVGPQACGENIWGCGWKTPLVQAPEGKLPRWDFFWFFICFFFLKVLNLQASLVGIFFLTGMGKVYMGEREWAGP